MTRRYIALKECAVIVRTELKAAFPSIRFSIRSESYSGGGHMTVRWTDGPSREQVEAITDQRYGTGFDGMTDSSTHHDGELNGERVHFSGSRPWCERTISPAMLAGVKAAYAMLTPHERSLLLEKTRARHAAFKQPDSWSLEDPALIDFGTDAPAVFEAMARRLPEPTRVAP